MKSKTHIVFLFLMLLVTPASAVLACGNSSEKESKQTTSCAKEDATSSKKSCCDKGDSDNDGCGGACDHASCHCPSSVNVPVSTNHLAFFTILNFNRLQSGWAYVQNAPKSVDFSIWQPPKIS